MKRAAFLSMIMSCIAWAELPPVFPKKLRGIVLSSLMDRKQIQISGGQPQSCKKTVVDPKWTSYRCEVKGTEAIVSRGNESKHFKFASVFLSYSIYKGQNLRQFSFRGTWKETYQGIPLVSPAELRIWWMDETPDDIRGTLYLKNYGNAESFQAVKVP